MSLGLRSNRRAASALILRSIAMSFSGISRALAAAGFRLVMRPKATVLDSADQNTVGSLCLPTRSDLPECGAAIRNTKDMVTPIHEMTVHERCMYVKTT